MSPRKHILSTCQESRSIYLGSQALAFTFTHFYCCSCWQGWAQPATTTGTLGEAASCSPCFSQVSPDLTLQPPGSHSSPQALFSEDVVGYKLVNEEWGLLHEQKSSWALGVSPCQCGKLRLGDAHHSYIPLPSRKKGSQVLRLSWRRRVDQAGVQGCPGAANGLNPLRPAPQNLSHTHKNGHRPLFRATTPRHQGHSTWEWVGAGTRRRVPSLTDRQSQAPWCRRPSTCHLNLH